MDRQKKEEEGQIGLVKLSWDLVLSYQTRKEGLKATPDNWWRLKVLLKCLVSVEKGGRRGLSLKMPSAFQPAE